MDDRLYAICADIHANQTALEAVVAEIDALAVERVICLGDIVGYGQGAAACLRMVRERGYLCIQGNHDAQVRPPRNDRMRPEAQVALDLAQEQLEEEEIDWLAALPTERDVDALFLAVHGAPTGRDDYLLTPDDMKTSFEALASREPPRRVCFFGHTHRPMVLTPEKVRTKFAETRVVSLDPESPHLINPGSVGQPRDGTPAASFAVYDPGVGQVTIMRVEYDVVTEQRRMERAGLPERLVKRLSKGR